MQDLDADLEDDENYNAEELKKLEVYKCRQVTPYKQRTNTATLGRLESKINKIKQEEKIKKKKSPRFWRGHQIHFRYGTI